VGWDFGLGGFGQLINQSINYPAVDSGFVDATEMLLLLSLRREY
jgi:hypothetical protein